MEDEEEITSLDEQFTAFAKYLATDRDGTTINLYRSDYWLRQSNVLNDRRINSTDTGITWMKFNKIELTFPEWCDYLTDLCISKGLNQREVETQLTCCGLPGSVQVIVPQYRDFFDTYVPANQLLNIEEKGRSC